MASKIKYDDLLLTPATDLAGQMMLQIWKRPALATATAATVELGILWEKIWRQLMFPFVETGVDDNINWHEGGAGKPLLLLNGFTASGLTWPVSWVRRLEENHRVIRMDNRGTGWSRGAPAPFTIADLADDARQVLEACGVDRAVVFGMSMGGMIGQELAIRHPDVVERLVVAATIPPIPMWVPTARGVSLAARMLSAGHDIEEPSLEQLEEAGRTLMQFAAEGFTPSFDLVSEMSAQTMVRATSRWSALMQARAIQAWHGAERLTSITAPTVIVHGADDKVIPIENAKRLAQLIPHAELLELPAVGHLVPWEAQDALVDIFSPERKHTDQSGDVKAAQDAP